MKVLPEGLAQSALRDVATHLKRYDKTKEEDKKLRSISLLRRCLEATGEDKANIETIVGPLGEVWHLRSSTAAHSSDAGLPMDRKTHYRGLLERCDKAMQALAEPIRASKLDIT